MMYVFEYLLYHLKPYGLASNIVLSNALSRTGNDPAKGASPAGASINVLSAVQNVVDVGS